MITTERLWEFLILLKLYVCQTAVSSFGDLVHGWSDDVEQDSLTSVVHEKSSLCAKVHDDNKYTKNIAQYCTVVDMWQAWVTISSDKISF